MAERPLMEESRVRRPLDSRGPLRLMLRLPGARDRLRRGYRSDAELRSLCDAFEEASRALEARQRTAAKIALEISEYTELIRELEADIGRRLRGEPASVGQERDVSTLSRRFGDWLRKVVRP